MDLPFEINSKGKLGDKPFSILKGMMKHAMKKGFATALAQSMAAPIRRNLDYAGIARKALFVEPMPQGALPIYDREPEEVGTGTLRVERVTIPEFEIVQNPTIRITEVKQRRFNLIDRESPYLRINPRGKLVGHKIKYTIIDKMVDNARYQIQEDVDREIFELLDKVGRDK